MINSINTDFFSQLKTQLPENFELIQVSENHYLAQSTQKNILFHSYLHISEAAFKLNPKSNPNTIHVFEDQWRLKPQIVLSRVLNGLGFSQKLMARKLTVEKLTRSEAASFFEENHLWGEAKAAYYYGLCLQKKIYMAASFSKSRVMTDSDIYYRSYELIRLASAKNNLVVGGFQKLLRHFIKEKNVVHLMTYLDLNYGDGKAFEQFGFKKHDTLSFQKMYINTQNHMRYHEKYLDLEKSNVDILTFENSTWVKMILDLR